MARTFAFAPDVVRETEVWHDKFDVVATVLHDEKFKDFADSHLDLIEVICTPDSIPDDPLAHFKSGAIDSHDIREISNITELLKSYAKVIKTKTVGDFELPEIWTDTHYNVIFETNI